jgi:hypothetical protein
MPGQFYPACRFDSAVVISKESYLPLVRHMNLDRWVNDDNPDEQLQYGKGWWDYIELIRHLMYKFGVVETKERWTTQPASRASFTTNGMSPRLCG